MPWIYSDIAHRNCQKQHRYVYTYLYSTVKTRYLKLHGRKSSPEINMLHVTARAVSIISIISTERDNINLFSICMRRARETKQNKAKQRNTTQKKTLPYCRLITRTNEKTTYTPSQHQDDFRQIREKKNGVSLFVFFFRTPALP